MIDFYLVDVPTIDASYNLVCKLIDKAYQQKKSVYIHTNSAKEAEVIDDLLWIFRDDAFIPHGLYKSPTTDIQIGFNGELTDKFNILINLTEKIPKFFTTFQRVLEIIPQNQKENGRKKYRSYRDKGYEIATHDLATLAK